MCVYVRNRRRRRDRNKVCVLSCQTARFHCHHHAFPNDGMFDSVSAMLLYLSSLFLSHRSLHWGIRHCLSPWSATLVCYSFTFPFCRACVQDFFIFLFLYHPPAPQAFHVWFLLAHMFFSHRWASGQMSARVSERGAVFRRCPTDIPDIHSHGANSC